MVLYDEPRKAPSYGVFISHSGEDMDLVKPLHDSLSRIVEIAPYVAEYYPKPGLDVKHKIATDLKDSYCVIVLLTRSGVSSQWVNQEIGYAYALPPFPRLIIPIVEEGILIRGFLEGVQYIKLDRTRFEDTISKVIYTLRTIIPKGHEIGALNLRIECKKCVNDLGFPYEYSIPLPIQPHINEIIQKGQVFATRCPKCQREYLFHPKTLIQLQGGG